MITVRKGVFETNSSSMHSICVMKNKGKYTDEDFWIDMYVWQDGELVLGGLEFERAPFRLLTTFKEKLEYAIASLCGNEEREAADDQFRKIESLVHKIEPKIESIKLHKIFTLADNEGNLYDIYSPRVHKDDDGYFIWNDKENNQKEYLFDADPSDWYRDYGDVDHQSLDLLNNFLASNNVSLEEFLVKKQYIVVVDGDEYHEFSKLLKLGIIDNDKIELLWRGN